MDRKNLNPSSPKSSHPWRRGDNPSPSWELPLSPVQLIAKQNLDQNDPKRGSKERQRIDHLQDKPAKPAEIFYQVVREVDPGLIQPVKNQVEDAPATKPYKSPKNIINNFHNIIDPTVWLGKKFPSGFSQVLFSAE